MSDSDTTVEALEKWLSRPDVAAMVDEKATGLLRRMEKKPESNAMASPLPGVRGLPDDVKSFRLFALRPAARYPFERHSNSRQWVRSLKGRGIIELRQTSGASLFHHLSTGDNAAQSWSSMPAGTWHKPQAAGNEIWLVATFHSSADVADEYENHTEPN